RPLARAAHLQQRDHQPAVVLCLPDRGLQLLDEAHRLGQQFLGGLAGLGQFDGPLGGRERQAEVGVGPQVVALRPGSAVPARRGRTSTAPARARAAGRGAPPPPPSPPVRRTAPPPAPPPPPPTPPPARPPAPRPRHPPLPRPLRPALPPAPPLRRRLRLGLL